MLLDVSHHFPLCHDKRYLENVISRFQLSNVNPLTVNVVPVSIPAANSDTLVSEVSAFIPLVNAWNE